MSEVKAVVIHRVNQSCTYSNAEKFIDGIAQLSALVASGQLSKDNVFVKYWTSPETIAKIAQIQPSDSLTESELIGYDSYSPEVQEKIKKTLNKNCGAGKYTNRQIVAALVAEASVENYKELDIQAAESWKSASMKWVDANVCSKEDSSKIFVSKKGANGGICLRVSQ